MQMVRQHGTHVVGHVAHYLILIYKMMCTYYSDLSYHSGCVAITLFKTCILPIL